MFSSQRKNPGSSDYSRIEAWPSILRKGLAHHLAAPFEWGVSDCAFVFDIVRDMTGYDAIADGRGYTTEAGAMKALKRAGFETMLDLFSARFPELDPAMAQRGDLGFPAVTPNPLMNPAIIDGASAFTKYPGGRLVVPRHAIARAWAV